MRTLSFSAANFVMRASASWNGEWVQSEQSDSIYVQAGPAAMQRRILLNPQCISPWCRNASGLDAVSAPPPPTVHTLGRAVRPSVSLNALSPL